MASFSMHVLDTTSGKPAAGLHIRLEARDPSGAFTEIGRYETNDDGRVPKSAGDALSPGIYQATFEAGPYLKAHHGGGFWPWVPVVFEVTEDGHYHIPLLLSPYGIASYRGS